MKKTTPRKTIMVVGAHLDDCWVGVGGFALQAVRKGHRVVFIQTVSDYSSWSCTKGREKEVDRQVHRIAEKRGIELRCLGGKYMHLLDDNELPTLIAQQVDELRPDMLFFHWFEDGNRDHWKSGVASLYGGGHPGCFLGHGSKWIPEMYSYEMPSRNFVPHVYCDISSELPDTLRAITECDKIHAGANAKPDCWWLAGATVEDEILKARFKLTSHSRIKYATAILRGLEGGAKYAEAFHAFRGRAVQEMLQI